MTGPAGLAPSPRKGAAQRTLSMTMLVVEAFIVFFAMLVAHGLMPQQRGTTWIYGGAVAAAMLIVAMMMRASRAGWPYLAGFVLQLAMILMGLWVAPMWVIGVAMAVLYTYSVVKGRQFDREKDIIDARHHARHDH